MPFQHKSALYLNVKLWNTPPGPIGRINRFIWTFQCLTLVLAWRSFLWAACWDTEQLLQMPASLSTNFRKQKPVWSSAISYFWFIITFFSSLLIKAATLWAVPFTVCFLPAVCNVKTTHRVKSKKVSSFSMPRLYETGNFRIFGHKVNEVVNDSPRRPGRPDAGWLGPPPAASAPPPAPGT